MNDKEYTETANLGAVEIPENMKQYMVELLKLQRKATTQKPDIESVKEKVISVKCPNCKRELFMCYYSGGKYNWNEAQRNNRYCKNCGQAIDWSNFDE